MSAVRNENDNVSGLDQRKSTPLIARHGFEPLPPSDGFSSMSEVGDDVEHNSLTGRNIAIEGEGSNPDLNGMAQPTEKVALAHEGNGTRSVGRDARRKQNAENFKAGVGALVAKYPNMPPNMKKRLEERVKHYERKGGRERSFRQKDRHELEVQISNGVTNGPARWDRAVIYANLNEDHEDVPICGQKLSDAVKSRDSFIELAVDVLALKLGREPDGNEKEKVANFAREMFANSCMGKREKLICMDYGIDKIVWDCQQHQEELPPPPTLDIVNGKLVLIKPTRTETLILQGGGGKGVGYSPALEELFNSGKLMSLRRVGGSSAGALAAFAVAFGIPPDKLQNFVDGIQTAMKEDKDEVRANYESNHPIHSITFHGTGQTALGVIRMLDKQSAEAASQFLQRTDLDFSGFTEDEISRLRTLRNSRFDPNRTKEQMITFHDMKMLGKIKVTNPPPNPFKNPIITVWNKTSGEQMYCDDENTPHMPICYAASASMRFPFKVKSMGLNFSNYGGKYEGRGLKEVCDGGVGSNSPSEIGIPGIDKALPHSIEMQNQQANTLTLIFDENGAAFRALSLKEGFQYGTGLKGTLASAAARMLGTNASVKANRAVENAKLNRTSNIMVVGHGDMDTTDFDASAERKDAARMMSRAMAWQQIKQRQGELSQIELVEVPSEATPAQVMESGGESIKQAAKCLSMEELQSVVNQETPAETALERMWRKACADEIQRRTNSQ